MQSGGLHLPQVHLRRAFLRGLHPRACLLRKHVLIRFKAVVMVSQPASANSLRADLQNLCKRINAFADAKPLVTGSERLLKRAQRDCSYVESLLEVASNFTANASSGNKLNSSLSQDLQGVRNNLRGLQAELDLAWQAEAVVCLGAKFYSNVSAGEYCLNIIMLS